MHKEEDKNLVMEHGTNEDHKHPNRVWKDFKMKSVGEYCDFYIQSDALLQLIYLKRLK